MSFLSNFKLHVCIAFLLVITNLISLKYLICIYIAIQSINIILNLRNDFAFLPLIIITKIQGKNFKLSRDLSEIKSCLKGSDKGHVIEELFAMPAWYPILSVESVNGKTWEIVKQNLMKFKAYIPSNKKIGLIAKKEAENLLQKKEKINSKSISKLTLKIFLKFLFCENNKPIITESNTDSDTNTVNDNEVSKKNENEKNKNNIQDSNNNDIEEKNRIPTYENTFKENDFDFIDQYLTEEYLENMFDWGIQWRKEIALKEKGCLDKKMKAINSIVNILKQSKFKNLFNWENPECYSFIMQPFIISPMINISDIAVSLKNKIDDFEKYEEFNGYLDHCLFEEHPFPILERYIKESNTQFFVDLRDMKNNFDEKEAAKILNFGTGIRGCLGKYYAKEFIKNFFEDIIKEDFFVPLEGHLYSGRNNDKENFQESIYQMKLLFGIIISEIKRNFFNIK
jgi:hypothetical protein